MPNLAQQLDFLQKEVKKEEGRLAEAQKVLESYPSIEQVWSVAREIGLSRTRLLQICSAAYNAEQAELAEEKASATR